MTELSCALDWYMREMAFFELTISFAKMRHAAFGGKACLPNLLKTCALQAKHFWDSVSYLIRKSLQ